ncbi:MAG: AAA family ATPase [Gammaproteobacteria bacterium]|nr:AAA family ATPase [Gammaproteobacteria bacterium]
MAENEFDTPDALPLTDSLNERLPSNQLAEYSLLIALFGSGDAWDEYGILVKPEWFMDPNHRIVFEEMQRAANRGEPLTPFAVATHIRDRFSDSKHPAVELAIGLHGVEPIDDIRHHLILVQNYYDRRTLIGVLKAASTEARESTGEGINDLIERIHQRIDKSSEGRLSVEDIAKSSAPALIQPVIEELAYIKEYGEARNYLDTGFRRLNELSWGGFRPGHLIVLAGRPGMGKTSFALNLCDNVLHTDDQDMTVLFFTLEQRTEEIMFKMLSAASGVPFGKLKTTRLNETEQKNLDIAVQNIEFYSNFIVMNPDGLTIAEMIHAVKQIKRAKGRLDLVCVDYIGLMQPDESKPWQSRTLEIADITRGLKNLANQEEVPILALAQLNRNADSRTDQRPRLSDLRDSGSIEQDADMVTMLHREESDRNDPNYNKVKLMVTKNRHGPLGVINLEFIEEITEFREIYERSEPLPDQ